MQIRIHHGLFWLLLITGFVTSAQATECDRSALSLAPYVARYRLSGHGLTAEGQQQLSEVSAGLFKVRNYASLAFMSIDETSQFMRDKNGNLQPLEYIFQRKGMTGGRDWHLLYEWDKQTVTNLVPGDAWTLAVTPGVQDLLSYQVQMRLDLLCQKQGLPTQLHFAAVKKRKVRNYDYRVLGREKLTTKLGSFNAVRLEKVDSEAGDKTVIWLAEDWEYLILRLEHSETKGNDGFIAEMLNAKMGGRTLTVAK